MILWDEETPRSDDGHLRQAEPADAMHDSTKVSANR
jgi:hypothetical protein